MKPRRGPAELHANLTPMIDVTFLLIVFFVLVSQIVEVDDVDMQLPRLTEPLTELPGEEQRAVVHVVPGTGGAAVAYRVGGASFPAGADGIDALSAHLEGVLAANPALRINLRADERTEYEWVQPVLSAVSQAVGDANLSITPRINLVVVRDE